MILSFIMVVDFTILHHFATPTSFTSIYVPIASLSLESTVIRNIRRKICMEGSLIRFKTNKTYINFSTCRMTEDWNISSIKAKKLPKREVWFSKYDPFDQQSQKQAFPVGIPGHRIERPTKRWRLKDGRSPKL